MTVSPTGWQGTGKSWILCDRLCHHVLDACYAIFDIAATATCSFTPHHRLQIQTVPLFARARMHGSSVRHSTQILTQTFHKYI
jgi:hypothetical protein